MAKSAEFINGLLIGGGFQPPSLLHRFVELFRCTGLSRCFVALHDADGG